MVIQRLNYPLTQCPLCIGDEWPFTQETDLYSANKITQEFFNDLGVANPILDHIVSVGETHLCERSGVKESSTLGKIRFSGDFFKVTSTVAQTCRRMYCSSQIFWHIPSCPMSIQPQINVALCQTTSPLDIFAAVGSHWASGIDASVTLVDSQISLLFRNWLIRLTEIYHHLWLKVQSDSEADGVLARITTKSSSVYESSRYEQKPF